MWKRLEAEQAERDATFARPVLDGDEAAALRHAAWLDARQTQVVLGRPFGRGRMAPSIKRLDRRPPDRALEAE